MALVRESAVGKKIKILLFFSLFLKSLKFFDIVFKTYLIFENCYCGMGGFFLAKIVRKKSKHYCFDFFRQPEEIMFSIFLWESCGRGATIRAPRRNL